jgi:hypothetical protein
MISGPAPEIKSRRIRPRLYITWLGMRSRCGNVAERSYPDYGGRGIYVCPEWDVSYAAFRDWALANGYSADLTLDRIDNDGAYEPTNCRWVTRLVQANNQRTNVRVEAFGETKTVAQWAADPRCATPAANLYHRLKAGWSPEQAIATPDTRHASVFAFGESKSIAGWADDPRCKVGRGTLAFRLRAGWSPERAIVTISRKSPTK